MADRWTDGIATRGGCMDRGSIRMTLRKRVVCAGLWIAVPAMGCLAGCNLIANLGQFDGATAADGAADAGGDGSQSTKGNHDGSMAEDARDGSVDEGASDGSM